MYLMQFRICNVLKKGEALSILLFNFALEYSIRNIQETKEWLELNETNQFLVYVYDNSAT